MIWYVFDSNIEIIYIGNSKEECEFYCKKNKWKKWQDNYLCCYIDKKYNYYIIDYNIEKIKKVISFQKTLDK